MRSTGTGRGAVRVMGTSALAPAGEPVSSRRRRHLVLLPGGLQAPAPRGGSVDRSEPGPPADRIPSVSTVSRPLRLTARGRAVGRTLALSAVAGLVVALSCLLRGPVPRPASVPVETLKTPSARTAIVGGGETLWSVALRVAPQADPQEEVEALRELNGLATSMVQAGQVLRIPGR